MSQTELNCDVAILGAGTAGLVARRSAKSEGASVLMLDPGPLGTTCARVGCMPSKLLIAAANQAHAAKHAPLFGVHPENIQICGDEVLTRVRRERDRFTGFVLESTEEAKEQGEFFQNRAKIKGPGILALEDGKEVQYQNLILATGSTPFIPKVFRDLKKVLTNENVFEIQELPKSLLVIGLGVIGLELGQAFHRLGVKTTLLGRSDTIGPLKDPRLKKAAEEIFAEECDLRTYTEAVRAADTDQGIEVTLRNASGTETLEVFEQVLVASGRTSSLRSLGLENLGVHPDASGSYSIDPKTLQLGDQPIFVPGDANGFHPLLHEASDDGKVAGRNAALYPRMENRKNRTRLEIAYCEPQIAIVGSGFPDSEKVSFATGLVDYSDQGRARVQAVNQGLAHIYGCKETGKLLGAELCAPHAEHLGHLLAWAVQQELSVKETLAMPFYHPVLEEGLRTALRDLQSNL